MNVIFLLIVALIVAQQPAYGAVTPTASNAATPAKQPTSSKQPTPSASPSASISDKEVQQLKDKVASKVSELNKKNQKAIAGVITQVKDDTLDVKKNDGNSIEIKIDDAITTIYQIAGTQKKEVKKSDLKKDTYVIVTGPMIDKSVTANTIYIDEQFLVQSGRITEVDKTDFSLKVVTQDKENYTLDVQARTQQQLLNIKTLETERTGFSKLKEGDVIHFVVKKTQGSETETRFDVEKMLVIPQEYFIKQ